MESESEQVGSVYHLSGDHMGHSDVLAILLRVDEVQEYSRNLLEVDLGIVSMK